MTKPKEDGGPAYPRVAVEWHNPQLGRTERLRPQEGMTLRDYFAGQALAAPRTIIYKEEIEIADICYKFADAMLEARKK